MSWQFCCLSSMLSTERQLPLKFCWPIIILIFTMYRKQATQELLVLVIKSLHQQVYWPIPGDVSLAYHYSTIGKTNGYLCEIFQYCYTRDLWKERQEWKLHVWWLNTRVRCNHLILKIDPFTVSVAILVGGQLRLKLQQMYGKLFNFQTM